MKSQISQYPKVVGYVYDAQKPAQVIAVSNTQRLAALGCTGEVRIVRVDGPTGITDMCNYTNSPINSTITSLSWSSAELGKLAIAYSNGFITCLNVAEKASRQSQILTEEWSSGKVSTGVNGISWHPFEPKIIASANQDGIVRLFDCRAPTIAAKIKTYGQRGFVATRDIEFDPFHADIFAEVSENGSLKVWDRRNQSKPLINKTKAHSGPILTMAWSPCWEWVIATGSRDKAVRIWDVSSCRSEMEAIDMKNDNSNGSNSGGSSSNVFTSAVAAMTQVGTTSGRNSNNSPISPSSHIKETVSEVVLVNTIFTSSEVSRLRWSITATGHSTHNTTTSTTATTTQTTTSTSNSNTSTSPSIAPLLATISTGAGTSAESAGHIAVWDLMNQNLPLCILKGHGHDMCGDFSWLNHNPTTSMYNLSNSTSNNSNNTIDNSNLTSNNPNIRRNQRGNTLKQSQSADTRRRSQTTTSNTSTTSTTSTIDTQLSPIDKQQQLSQHTDSSTTGTRQINPLTSLILGILSSGRDGKVLMQDLRYAFFPNHHISPSVTAISSKGHVAFQRGYVHKKFSTSVRSPYYFDNFASYCAALAEFRKREAPEVIQRQLSSLKASDSSDNFAVTLSNSSSSSSSSSSNNNNTNGGSNKGKNKTNALLIKEKNDSNNSPRVTTTATTEGNNSQDRRSGVVFFGSQTILSLEDAQRIRQERAAEARVTDPALIAIFAKRYRVPSTLDPIISSSGNNIEGSNHVLPGEEEFLTALELEELEWHRNASRKHTRALQACRSNLKTAVAAGLHCRVAVWTTLLSLLPGPVRPVISPQIEEVAVADAHTLSLLGGAFDGKEGPGTPTGYSELEQDSPYPCSRKNSFREIQSTKKITVREKFSELPFTLELLGTLLCELLEGGDVQHFVVSCEILRQGGILKSVCQAVNLSELRVQRGYLVYIDLLTKLSLFCEVTDLLKVSDDKYISTLNQIGVEIGIKCSKCNKELSSKTSTGWCERCARCVSICVVCNKPASGLVHWCPLCAHGGHLACTQRWFRQSNECPAGCGHNCCSSLYTIQQQQHSTTSSTGVPEIARFKRVETLRALDYCIAVAQCGGVRSRSGSRATTQRFTPNYTSSGGSSNLMNNTGALDVSLSSTISDNTLQRHLLRRKKFLALYATKQLK